jgi:HK97 gp10 family phage protein
MPIARFVVTRVADPGEVASQLEPKMRNLGNAIARRMQRLVPKKTWALHDTVDTETEVNGMTVTTRAGAGGGKVGYALFVERGTSKSPAQPYMRPALLQSRAGDFKEGTAPARHGVAAARPARRSR